MKAMGPAARTDCSRVTSSGSSFLNIPDTYEFAGQRLHAYVNVDAPNIGSIQNDVQQCTVQGAAAAGLVAIISSPAGAMPAFQEAFEACMTDRALNYTNIELSVEPECMW